MALKKKSLAICYLSPQGTTKKVGRKLASFLEKYEFKATEYDLARFDPTGGGIEIAEKAARASLIIVGTPVYAHHPAYPVTSFIKHLPDAEGAPTVVYATFGGVSAGAALHDMAQMLVLKGYSVKGAANVLCVHSMMFRSKDPLGREHPGEEDWRILEEWIDSLAERLEPGSEPELDLGLVRIDDRLQRFLESTAFDMSFMSKFMPRIHFDPAKCTECGACQKRCPIGRLDVIPDVPRSEDCLYCYECVRVCPEGAINAPMKYTYPVMRLFRRISSRSEALITQTYL